MARVSRAVAFLAICVSDGAPSEFRIFQSGWNDTLKGKFLFDVEAASQVMAAYSDHGVDLMLDLEHLSLDPDARNYDPDARGWARLELRNGELWAVSVRWTPEGAARLNEKRQRYISPAFEFDPTNKRITALINAAITSLPATKQAPALVAASMTGGMKPEDAKAALEAIKNGDADGAMAILEAMIVSAAAPEAEAEAPAEMMAEEAEAPAEKPEEEEKPMAAAASRLLKLSGRSSLNEALDDAAMWRKSHLELETQRADVAKDRAALEADERRNLVNRLIAMGVETPATAFEDPTAEPKDLSLCTRLVGEPIADLRGRVAKLSAARGTAGKTPQAPSMPRESTSLSERELALCKSKKIDPKKYAEIRASIAARSVRAVQGA